MYGIGTVARLAQVSVRTLRHYDHLGLLRPARVDPRTGYRSYAPEQVLQLHRILALRDLGVPLSEIRRLLEAEVSVEQLRGILRLRQAEVNARLAAQADQLRRVEIRLAHLEEGAMSDYEVIVKPLEAMRLVALSEELRGPEEIGAATGRMYPRLHEARSRHGVESGGISLALYERSGDEERPMRLTTALPVPDGTTVEGDGLWTLELTAVARAATTVVRGAPERFGDGFRALFDWIERNGDHPATEEREVYVDCDGPPETWVTELQVILEPAAR
jgi:DNA-binding transcriptional MerR regulator